MCQHQTATQPSCPSAGATDREAAKVIAHYSEVGYSVLCNGVVVFDDTGDLLPDGRKIDPHRGPARHSFT